ncbi:uncharacterized protein F5891DRAFT_1209440 [Suillus fuscotomentosus]|uniref:Bromo domain-containing protein n=1 Tax=Suillus fuscotomentosus TaxID=1912939 RepID=A0AAD4DS65_9AGAM|nr:uncharacterized protein F5891DRAFT_1209440 [Suillus fuscotomentosus]KAG1892955.1 hypothetical protein F5891DRAFT_1209440 [Suillus fuscotomentosus]
MQNLLRTLTESQVKPSSDLRLLLSAVKDARRQSFDAKVSEPFYDSLEGLLHDLRTVTMDNHDAEAFLKPVAKSDVPDYYDVIVNPMDLQTMLKKVKSKQYKSKREFADDLDLIWSNCFTYNATEVCITVVKTRGEAHCAAQDHPLRQCAMRLKKKADRLLKNITDRKERIDPPLPAALSQPPNSASPVAMRPNATARPKINGTAYTHRRSPSLTVPQSSKQRMDLPFADSPALERTPHGMAAFRALESEAGPSSIPNGYSSSASTNDYDSEVDEALMSIDNDLGEKRKLNGSSYHPRKRVRLIPAPFAPLPTANDPNSTWWSSVQSDSFLANGLPALPQPFAALTLYPQSQPTASSSQFTRPRKRRKLRPQSIAKYKDRDTPAPNTLLSIMNTNIKTLKRVRRTHAKFAALNLNAEEGGMGDEPPDIGEEGMVDEVIDERPWRSRYAGLRQVKGPVELEVGEKNADECLKWMNRKVLEHEGFQGTSGAALDVLVGVTSEYFLNVGRTLRFMCDKYAKSMTPEEIILHTLFESGVTRIQDLERYIKDDVVRHGSRLVDLEKKLVGAYREATQVEVLDDDALFAGEDDEEDESAFVMGGFSDSLGDDFLGLRELGIAAELGLSSLTIPKKLLKGKSRGAAGAAIEAKPKEPPPPYPPPPPLLPITSKNVGDQIGLLRHYFQVRLASLAPPGTLQGLPYLPPGPQFGFLPHPGVLPLPYVPNSSGDFARIITIPDDAPAPAQAKLGPLGQVLKTGAAAGAVKKKNKAKEPGPMSGPGMSDAVPVEPMRAFNGLGPEGKDVGGTGAGNGGTNGSSGGSNAAGSGGTLGMAGGSKKKPSPQGQGRAMELPPVIAASA